MYGRAEQLVKSLPQTPTQLSRGFLALGVGGIVAILATLLISLLDAPLWFTLLLGALAALAVGFAIITPLWLWIYQPFIRGNENADGAEDEAAAE